MSTIWVPSPSPATTISMSNATNYWNPLYQSPSWAVPPYLYTPDPMTEAKAKIKDVFIDPFDSTSDRRLARCSGAVMALLALGPLTPDLWDRALDLTLELVQLDRLMEDPMEFPECDYDRGDVR